MITRWQWIVLSLPIVSILGFLGVAAFSQIHDWGLNWVWAIIVLLLFFWRLLLLRWLQMPETQLGEVLLNGSSPKVNDAAPNAALDQRALEVVRQSLETARQDIVPWENWPLFWQRAQELVTAIAQVYYPDVKRPLLQIYVPQAYGLIRDSVDDVDRWMQTLSPLLGQVTVGQAVRAYELSQKLAPAARWGLIAWSWAQWITNPTVAATKTVTQESQNRANRELIANMGLLMREQILKALGLRAIALYGRKKKPPTLEEKSPDAAVSQTLRQILEQARPLASLETKPVNLFIVGRTGAGKSSLINTLFQTPQAAVDVLPSTDVIQDYRWQSETGEDMILWDTPGYEQIQGPTLPEQMQGILPQCDVLLLVTPALDPALEPDLDVLARVQATAANVPVVILVSQVDRLRPLREWSPPYDWERGEMPKERSIRDAIAYRQERFRAFNPIILPIVTADIQQNRTPWGELELIQTLFTTIDPAKQVRLGRCLRDREGRIAAAYRIIDRYSALMATGQGIADLVKGPLLQFLSTTLTGSPAAAWLLAEKLPLEQSPVVLCKMQMAYELFSLMGDRPALRDRLASPKLDLGRIWPLLLRCPPPLEQDAWAVGHTLVEYWSRDGNLSVGGPDIDTRYDYYRKRYLENVGSKISSG